MFALNISPPERDGLTEQSDTATGEHAVNNEDAMKAKLVSALRANPFPVVMHANCSLSHDYCLGVDEW